MMVTNRFGDEIKHGEHLFQNGNIEEALKMFESILEKDPDNVAALNDKGVALNTLERFQEAIQIFLQVLQKDKGNSTAVFNLISNYFAIGKWKEAEHTLVEYGHYLPQQDIDMIKRDLETFKCSQKSAPKCDLSAGVAELGYQQVQERLNNILRKNIFFIVGIPKSGTTWLQNILNGHPEIRCMAESNVKWLLQSLRQVTNHYNSGVTDMNEGIGQHVEYATFTKDDVSYLYVTAVALLFSNVLGRSNVKCIGTKNPDILTIVDTMGELLPRAKYIHIIRDGRDVLTSGWFHNLRVAPKVLRERYPDFQRYAKAHAGKWKSDVQKARSFGRMYSESYFELLYENLHRNPDTVIRQILEFLEVDSSEMRIRQCRENGSFEKLSNGRQRGQENRNAFFRKGVVGDWKNLFDRDCLDIFMEYDGELLQELGYE